MLHQTVIGQEALEQMEMAGEYPDFVVGCVGGGSNFAGIAFPFVGENLKKGKKTRIIAVEPTACPSMTKGIYAYDFGDMAKLTPLLKMYTLGHDFIPPGIHAGGLRYHGMAPMVSARLQLGSDRGRVGQQTDVLRRRRQLRPLRGHHPGSGEHATPSRQSRQLAEECKQSGDAKTILFNLSGHGHFDMAAYDNYLDGKLEDYAYPEEKIKEAMKNLPKV